MKNNYRRVNITLTDEEKKQLLEEIIYYFETERDENLGIIGSESILDFFMDTLGVTIYNRALDDAKLWLSKRMEENEADYYALYK
ncbi:DUF2164 domain-containing protein [Herbinix luporum]|uniref:DUF2164 domain-containing protein n=1 Tax=Herbinix luporum TaxID=1679721 RepID=UPI0017747A26|nr:DUF2164 domain-containing protein [Herbinix luporum]HHT56358.1 DUF2164 domain-containing protein [Herbinix luporum]